MPTGCCICSGDDGVGVFVSQLELAKSSTEKPSLWVSTTDSVIHNWVSLSLSILRLVLLRFLSQLTWRIQLFLSTRDGSISWFQGSQQSWNSWNCKVVLKFEIVLKSQSFSANVLILTIVVRAQWQFNVSVAALLIYLLHMWIQFYVLLCLVVSYS